MRRLAAVTTDGLGLGPLHQVAQRATEMERSVAFYRDTLGLELIAHFDPPGLAFFRLGDTRLMLERQAPSSTLYLRVGDIEAAHQELVRRGVAFEADPHLVHRDDEGRFGPAGEEEWMAFFRDPDANLLALVSRR